MYNLHNRISYFYSMVTQRNLAKFINEGYKEFIPHISLDCSIFGYHENHLRILLSRWRGVEKWCLPGGYISRQESIDRAAHRILKERTGLDGVFLKQYYTFGDLDRNKTFHEPSLKASEFYEQIKGSWLDNRTISIGYYALVDYTRTIPVPDELSVECCWWNIQNLPLLLFDHDQMIKMALESLRQKINHEPVGMNLMQDQFTLPELQRLYETILGTSLDRRNFQKKILGLGILMPLNRQRKIGPHRSPNLYSFNRKKYAQALEQHKGISL